MSLFFPDIVQITNVTVNTYGTETKGTPFNSKAYVEDDTGIKFGSDGQPIQPDTLIVLPKGTNISKGDLVAIIELHGFTVIGIDAMKKKVRTRSRVGGMTVSHIEVTV